MDIGYWADLHVHTVLSPCAEVEMIPPLIVERALALGLSMIAVTDHNSSANAGAVMEAARGTGLVVWPGMELQTREEVHLLCLFNQLGCCEEWQSVVRQHLPDLQNREEFFGPQFVVDASGDWRRTETQLLSVSADLGLEEAAAQVKELGGIVIPAHVDRPSFSLMVNLGFVPSGLKADALEVSSRFVPPDGRGKWPFMAGWTLLVNGDAHRLVEIRKQTCFQVNEVTWPEISLALKGEEDRRVTVNWMHS
jgi:3',5'-nucleoside bisphosphate phosphatase